MGKKLREKYGLNLEREDTEENFMEVRLLVIYKHGVSVLLRRHTGPRKLFQLQILTSPHSRNT